MNANHYFKKKRVEMKIYKIKVSYLYLKIINFKKGPDKI